MNKPMSSQDIALYLCEAASNERKLEYCRQILAVNTNFVPEAIFSLNSPQPRTSISRHDFFSVLLAEEVHHADVEASEVHSQPRRFFEHRVRQASVNLPQSCKSMRSKYMKHPMRGSHLLGTLVKLRLYLRELDGCIDHRAADACHKARGHQLRFLGNLQVAHKFLFSHSFQYEERQNDLNLNGQISAI